MTREEIVTALRHLMVETGSLACLGCGREHNCSTSGCRIMRCAADLLENDAAREWIPVTERLPEEHESIFAKAYGTKRWADGMFRTISDDVLAYIKFGDGGKLTMTLRTHDGKWALPGIRWGRVTHWMPLPDAPEVE